jgi:uncharacterized SAM-binding protein YcdF (DUF218 family)
MLWEWAAPNCRIEMTLPENAIQSDCIIIPGCKVSDTTPSLALQSRLDCALRLYRAGYAKFIITSGGQGETGTITEAQAMQRYLMENGVPEEAILLEENSYSTYENMKNSKALMDAHQLTSAIVATSDFHAARAMAIDTARIALAPRRPLLGVPSSFSMMASRSACWVASSPSRAAAISVLMLLAAVRQPLPR